MLIGITGFAGAGKSTVAETLCGQAFGFRRLAFAAPLKTMLASVGFTHEQLYGSEKEVVMPDLGVTPRHAMQTLGTDWGREMISPDIWVTLWTRKARELLADREQIVADDVRFPNEVAAIKALGGQIWRVERPGTAQMSHASESHDLPYDRRLINDGSKADLSWLAAEMLRDVA
jgi:hypothetical protein